MTVMEQEITAYVERVRAALADLPPTVREELTEDLPEHIAEVAAEGDGTLVERLGEPEAYAAELRAAAGAPVVTGPNLDQRVAGAMLGLRTRLRTLDGRVGPALGYPTASAYLRLLRPAWWLLRGYLAAMLITAISAGGDVGVLPSLGFSRLAGLVLLAGCVLASLWLGRNGDRFGKWPRRAVLTGSLVLVLFGLVGLAAVDSRARWGGYGYDAVSVDDQYSHIQDVFVYDSEGRLLEGVRLFDQNGTPIRLGWSESCGEFEPAPTSDDPMRRTYPYCPQRAPFQVRPSPPAENAGPAPTPTATVPAPGAPVAPSSAPGPGEPPPTR
ncbi:hypothetical protein O7606_14185 [Micromonospora sp. WMMD882]|uniref:HAAS signaling domain-containing protein n=1 Tax=Micromonospora sp. WMMD882 TaxID=3015151 RepID=UPI00248C4F43|nr:hypothetical protein [Micromonospora sp. WMMD882]WBB77438.1 hypothetical protein O7606_14185 [Micromonospora sp. WMMD882]